MSYCMVLMERYPGRIPFSVGIIPIQLKQRFCVEFDDSTCILCIRGLTTSMGVLLSREIDRVITLFTTSVDKDWYPKNIYKDLKTVTNAARTSIVREQMITKNSGQVVKEVVQDIVECTKCLTLIPTPFLSDTGDRSRIWLDERVKKSIMGRLSKEDCNCNN